MIAMDDWVSKARAYVGSWPREAASYFRDTWGIDSDYAQKFALLYVLLFLAGLNPRITSGFRDPSRQLELQRQWDAGNRAGLRTRPATSSTHSAVGWLKSPASKGIDIVSTNEKLAGDIARAIGLRAGYYFTAKDPGHYDVL